MSAALTVAQVASELQVSRDVVYEAVRRGEIPSLRIGRTVRIPASWLTAATSGPSTPARPHRACVEGRAVPGLRALRGSGGRTRGSRF